MIYLKMKLLYRGMSMTFYFVQNYRDLSNNKLSGGVPEFLANMKSLLLM